MKLRIVVPVALSAVALLVSARGRPQGPVPGEGYIQVPGGRVWYRIVGSGPRTPLLVLHGCCGAASYYLKPLAALADERPVIYYDELGTGHSDHPPDTTSLRLERLVDELARVRLALGLKEVHLYGHSWGAALAVEYMLTHPAGVHSLVLAGPALSIPRAQHDRDSLRATLPESVQVVLVRHERAGTCDSPEYQAAMREFQNRFFTRRQPRSADLDSSFASFQLSTSLYRKMGGRPCAVAGQIPPTYDRTGRLGEIAVPTLFTAGRFDTETPATTRFYQSLVPGSELVIMENSGHLTMQDEPEHYIQVLRDFLRRVEAR